MKFVIAIVVALIASSANASYEQEAEATTGIEVATINERVQSAAEPIAIAEAKTDKVAHVRETGGCKAAGATEIASKASWGANAFGLIGFGAVVALRTVSGILKNANGCN